MDGDACILIRVASALGSDHVRLPRHWLADVDDAVLEHDGGIAEDDVDGAVYVAGFVELTLGLGEERVLVAFEAAAVEDG